MFDEVVCSSVGRCGIRWTISLLFCLDAEGINGEILANFFMDDTSSLHALHERPQGSLKETSFQRRNTILLMPALKVL